jgi:Tfp pilus assembly protein PilN
MIRINLLPKEIQEKRRYERYFVWVYVTAAVLVFLIVGVWFVLTLEVNSKNDDLQSRQELASKLQAEADAYSVFEQKQSALTTREAVAQQALAGRIDWAKVGYEVSLVLPSDTWTTGITANQDTGLSLSLVARDIKGSPEVGQKTLARTMVRLNDLDDLFDVWLSSSTRSDPVEGSAEGRITYQLSTQVAKPDSASTPDASGAPAPPAQ